MDLFRLPSFEANCLHLCVLPGQRMYNGVFDCVKKVHANNGADSAFDP